MFRIALCTALACATEMSVAGPPFLTDDPEPTATGHWEIYAPLLEAEGRGSDFEGSTGVELNYGAAANLQLTLDLPIAYSHHHTAWHWGAGDIDLSAKYRFFDDEGAGLQVAVFPGISVPSGSNGMGAGRVTALLPLWLQKDSGPWTMFGGGGYAINPGVGKRDYWSGGVAVARHFGERLFVGMEADRRGADAQDSDASTSLGLGAIYQLNPPLRLLASGGPTFADHGGAPSFHTFVALGLDF